MVEEPLYVPHPNTNPTAQLVDYHESLPILSDGYPGFTLAWWGIPDHRLEILELQQVPGYAVLHLHPDGRNRLESTMTSAPDR